YCLIMEDRIKALQAELKTLETELARPDAYQDPAIGQKTRRLGELKKILLLNEEKNALETQVEEARQLSGSDDVEMAELAKSELETAKVKLARVQAQLEEALTPKDPNEDKDVIIEIRAGAGGDEAALFAGDLYRMYVRYAEQQRFKTELINESPAEAGGFK